jgi:hypothetical protein
MVGVVLGCAIGYPLNRTLVQHKRRKRLGGYVARLGAELKLEHEEELHLLEAHEADQDRGGVYRRRGSDPPAPPRAGPGE